MMDEGKILIKKSKQIVFMTGAGVSTPSGIPDYRSMTGVYQGIDQPEYLLSYTCLLEESDKFYSFVKQLYHEEAKPNQIHLKMKELEQTHNVTIITQNIDGLHDRAQSQNVINFHGNLHDCFCMKCLSHISVNDYLNSDHHLRCGGLIRPNIVLYGEDLSETTIKKAIESISKADLIVIVGTSFRVYPFSSLINYRHKTSQIMVINNELIDLSEPYLKITEQAEDFFGRL